MSKLEIYCVTNKAIKSLEKYNYTLCSVGKENLPENYLKCNKGDNIFIKTAHLVHYFCFVRIFKSLIEFLIVYFLLCHCAASVLFSTRSTKLSDY